MGADMSVMPAMANYEFPFMLRKDCAPQNATKSVTACEIYSGADGKPDMMRCVQGQRLAMTAANVPRGTFTISSNDPEFAQEPAVAAALKSNQLVPSAFASDAIMRRKMVTPITTPPVIINSLGSAKPLLDTVPPVTGQKTEQFTPMNYTQGYNYGY